MTGLDLELRRRCISSTDVGPIFGVDGYRDAFDVYMDKMGDRAPFEPTARMLMGKDVEQAIVKAYSRITERPAEWCDCTVQHAEMKWMAATPDALVYEPDHRHIERGVDAKLVYWDQRRKWGPTPDDIPEGIQLQMIWMMAVLNCDRWDVAAWAGEDEPRIYEFERNYTLERVVIEKTEEWYRRHLVGGEMPPITGSAAAAKWLQRTFPAHKSPDLRAATPEEIEYLREYACVRAEQKEATERRKEMENQIKLAIADREGLEWATGKFTWRLSADRHIHNWEGLAKHLLITRIKDPEQRAALEEEYTRTEPGMRKIHFVCDDYDVAE